MSLEVELSSKGVIQSDNSRISTLGKILLGLTGGVALGLTVICVPFVSPALRKFCLPFVPATNAQLSNIFVALKGRQGSVLDLGSGDGRIVLEAARRNFTSHGIELNPWLVLYAKLDAFRKGLHSRTQFFCGDLWKFNLAPYDNIVIFGVKQMMADLEKKLVQECGKDCNIVACRFPLPNKRPSVIVGKGIDTVWVYHGDNLK